MPAGLINMLNMSTIQTMTPSRGAFALNFDCNQGINLFQINVPFFRRFQGD